MYVVVGSSLGVSSHNFSGTASLKKQVFTTPDPSTANKLRIFGCFDLMLILFTQTLFVQPCYYVLHMFFSLQISASSGSDDLSGPSSTRSLHAGR